LFAVPGRACVDPLWLWHPTIPHELVELGGRHADISRRLDARKPTWRQCGGQGIGVARRGGHTSVASE
jgi:hypothetical protein